MEKPRFEDDCRPVQGARQFTLRGAVLCLTALAMVLSGAFTSPLCILLGCLGLVFLWTGLKSDGEVLLLGIIAGLGWIGMAALIDQLLRTTGPG